MDQKHLHVEFFMDKRQNKRKSAEAARPIFDEIEKVRIRIAGDKRTVHVAPAHEPFKLDDNSGRHLTYAEVFEKHYEAFQKGREVAGSGTPIEELAFLTSAQRAELKAVNIFTAEALADLNHSGVKRLGMGGRELVDQAKAYLDKADAAVTAGEYAKREAAMQAEIAELRAMISAPAKEEPKKDATGSPADWSDDELRQYLTERGAAPRANAAHDKMVAAVEAFMADEMEAA